MKEPLCESFWDYRESFKRRMRVRLAEHAAEPDGPEYAARPPATSIVPLTERLVQTIWAQQLLQPLALRLADGTPLRVLDPGRWNGSAGPDFKSVHLMIGTEAVEGDVEVHLDSRDWLAHGHQRDLAYNTVVLHVVLRISDGKTHDPPHNGNNVPRLELEPFIFPDLETLRRSLTPDDYQYTQPAGLGRCATMLADLAAPVVADFLDRAGDERLVSKMQRMDEQARHADLEQVFYQALMMSLGAGAGKTLYYLLAKRTPLAEMMDYVRDLPEAQWAAGFEALLLHVGGLALTPEELTDAPAEARERAARLCALWGQFEPFWSDRVIPPTRRWYQGIRPVNFPVRRLAAVASLLARAMRTGKLPLADLLARIRTGQAMLKDARPTRRRHPLLVELIDWFCVEGKGHFWGTHYSYTARPSERVLDLIGEGMALSLAFNALLPAALLAARREGDADLAEAIRRLYSLVPPLQPNHITEFMTKRLFGDDERAPQLINTERRRQGLFQIFHACCNSEERHCETCYYIQT